METSAFDEPMEEVKDYSNEKFKFMQSLAVHSGSVRAVATSEKGVMLSGSVDNSCKLFSLDETTGRYEFIQELNHHEHYVYSVSCALDNNGFFTWGKDQKIFLVDNHGNPEKLFEGHSQLVNMVVQIDDKTIVSGCWDGTAKVWEISSGKWLATYDGHSHAVAVFADPNGRVITGSQDKKIKIWGRNYKLEKEWIAHEDIIRRFADFSPLGFIQ